MLHSRVKLILSYIKSVENGKLQPNSEILREAYSLAQRLPVIQTSTFREEYYTVNFIFFSFFVEMALTFQKMQCLFLFFSFIIFSAIKRCWFDNIFGRINKRVQRHKPFREQIQYSL